MSQVFEVDPGSPNASSGAIEAAARALAEGRLVVMPTETVYGIAARPDDPSATGRLFTTKHRPSGLNLPVLTASTEQAWELAIRDDRVTRLAGAFWPGPCTMVLPRSERARPWALGDREDSIALRVPDHALTCALLEAAGPLAATSANRSGRPPLSDLQGLVRAFGRSVAVYLVLAPGASLPGGTASTVVDLTGATMRILRHGPISAERIEQVAGR